MFRCVFDRLLKGFFFALLSSLLTSSLFASNDFNCHSLPSRTLDVANSKGGPLTWRGQGTQPGEPECFALHIPVAGTLMLEAIFSESALAEPKIDFRSQLCSSSAHQNHSFTYQQRYAGRMLVEIFDAGWYATCVSTEDPADFLESFRIVSAFQPLNLEKSEDPDEHEPIPDPFVGGFHKSEDPDEHEPIPDPIFGGFEKSEDPDEHEPIPDPIFGGFDKSEDPDEHEPIPDPIFGSFDKSEDPDEHEPIPDPIFCGFEKDEDPDEHEPIPDPFVAQQLCHQDGIDDHGDTFLCATAVEMGQEITLEINNAWGDDIDLLTFVIDELVTVRLNFRGSATPIASLHDESGYRLKTATAQDAPGEDFRIVKTLSPGRYFVRVGDAYGVEDIVQVRIERLSPN